MEENTQSQQAQQSTAQQPTQDKPKGLMPGQEREDELDYMGRAFFGFIQKGFEWIKQRLAANK